MLLNFINVSQCSTPNLQRSYQSFTSCPTLLQRTGLIIILKQHRQTKSWFSFIFFLHRANNVSKSVKLLSASGLLLNIGCSLYRQASYCPPRPEVKEHSGEEERDLLHRRPGSSCTPWLSHRHHRHRSKPQSGNQKVGATARAPRKHSTSSSLCSVCFCQALTASACPFIMTWASLWVNVTPFSLWQTGVLLSPRASVLGCHSMSLNLQKCHRGELGSVNKEASPLERRAFCLSPLRLKETVLFEPAGLPGLHPSYKSIILSPLALLFIPEGRDSVLKLALCLHGEMGHPGTWGHEGPWNESSVNSWFEI